MASRRPHAPEQKAADENMTIKNGGEGLKHYNEGLGGGVVINQYTKQ